MVDELGLGMAEVTGAAGGKTTVPGVRGDLSEILTCFSPVSKERDTVYPRLAGKDIDVLIATDCISEGQNLQDCDLLVNFDIHWNPVRVVQRFGRVDRIGSKNDRIQLVNFWPNVELDKYIQLKERVENRMHATVMASTGDDDYLNEDEKGDLEYRRAQLEQMQSEVVDLEDVSGGVSITDLGLNDFRMDLVAYHEAHPDIERAPAGIAAVVAGEVPGIIFVLRNVNQQLDATLRNPVHPFYLVYVKDDGEVLHGYLDPKETLDAMRRLCRGNRSRMPRPAVRTTAPPRTGATWATPRSCLRRRCFRWWTRSARRISTASSARAPRVFWKTTWRGSMTSSSCAFWW